MAVYETYYNRHEGWRGGVEPAGEVIFIQRSKGHVLSPSWELLNEWQSRKATKMIWEQYTNRFLKEMQSQKAQEEIARLARLATEKDVWLVCSCSNKRRECHRYIVMDLIQKKMQEG